MVITQSQPLGPTCWSFENNVTLFSFFREEVYFLLHRPRLLNFFFVLNTALSGFTQRQSPYNAVSGLSKGLSLPVSPTIQFKPRSAPQDENAELLLCGAFRTGDGNKGAAPARTADARHRTAPHARAAAAPRPPPPRGAGRE